MPGSAGQGWPGTGAGRGHQGPPRVLPDPLLTPASSGATGGVRPEADGPTRASARPFCNWAGSVGTKLGKEVSAKDSNATLCQRWDVPEEPRRAEGPPAPGKTPGPNPSRSPQPAARGELTGGQGGPFLTGTLSVSMWPLGHRASPLGEGAPRSPGWPALQGLLGLFGSGRAREKKQVRTRSHRQAPGVPCPCLGWARLHPAPCPGRGNSQRQR